MEERAVEMGLGLHPLPLCHFRLAHSQRRGSVERRSDLSTVVAAEGSP